MAWKSHEVPGMEWEQGWKSLPVAHVFWRINKNLPEVKVDADDPKQNYFLEWFYLALEWTTSS